MTRYLNVSMLLTFCLSISAGSIQALAQEEAAPDPSEETIAVVNGEPISREMFQAYVMQRQAQIGNRVNDPEVQQALLDAILSQELLVQEAKQQDLDEDPEIMAQMEQMELQLEMAKRNILTRAMLNKVLAENQPSEEAIQEEYQKMEGKQEYKARHILVDSEEKAQALIDQLAEDADFAELAESESTDSSAAQGGDLGWFTTDMMVEPFSNAVAELEKGEYTKEPVQTQFGWHVIKLEDVRESTPPPLDQVRNQIVQNLQRPMINDYVEKLREVSDIEIKE